MPWIQFIVLAVWLIAMPVVSATPLIVEHDLQVTIDPAAGHIQVRDRLTLPDDATTWELLLPVKMSPRVVDGSARLTAAGQSRHLARYRLQRRAPGPITLAYSGEIRHAFEEIAESVGRTRAWSRGIIGADGVFLDGNSAWYPRIPDSLQRFRLEVSLPEGWLAVSQGAGPGEHPATGSRWIETQPQDDIYLIAAPFTLYRQVVDGFEAQVYLRTPDPALAERYLTATVDTIARYADMIGPYPFAKFALVENFWETGYGMPSFTLLGSRVIRLPFILQTSYPHEILHNWWGNSVYIGDRLGNWAEGLTTYLADHLMRERLGQGAAYRRDALKRFADSVRDGQDFPLREFRARHGGATQAVGYDKSAMLFHMLRRQLGDPPFVAGLRQLYREHRFQHADFDDVRLAFEQVSGQDLEAFFTPWLLRTGAPRLALDAVAVQKSTRGRLTLSARIRQIQTEPPFPLRVPVVIDQQDGSRKRIELDLPGREAHLHLPLAQPPLRLRVDPDYDVFRDLASGEAASVFSELFQSARGTILLPARAAPPLLEAYRALAETWRRGHRGWSIGLDVDYARLPEDRPVWLLGWENRHLPAFARDIAELQLDGESTTWQLGQTRQRRDQASLALIHPQADLPIAWLGAPDADALPLLGRKLPHYGKFSYVSFRGAEQENQLKGQWPARDSALTHWFVDPRPLPDAEAAPGDWWRGL